MYHSRRKQNTFLSYFYTISFCLTYTNVPPTKTQPPGTTDELHCWRAVLGLLVEDELCFFLLGLVHGYAGEHRLGQLVILAALDHESDLHVHLAALGGDVVDRLLGQRGELVHVQVHLHVLDTVVDAFEDGARAADEDGLGVVRGNGARDAQLVQVCARVDHLHSIDEGEGKNTS